MTRVQRLIQDILDSLTLFNTSLRQVGGSGTDPQNRAGESDTSPAVPAAEKNIDNGEAPPQLKINPCRDWSEKVTDLVTTNTYSLDHPKWRLLWEEFRMRYARQSEDSAWIAEFKRQVHNVSGGADSLTLNGHEVATYRRNGNLNLKDLEAARPDLVARYTRLVQELKFDKEAFQKEEPELFEEFRAPVFRVNAAVTD